MLPFLMQDGVSDVLINFITRMDPTLLPQGDGTIPFTSYIHMAQITFI